MTPAIYDGDRGFRGVNERLAPDRLEPGMVSRAVNCRFRTGEAGSRGASVICNLGPDHSGRQPFDRPHAATSYRTSDGQQWIIVASGGKAWRAKTHQTAVEIPLPAGVTLADPIEFTQAGNNLYMFRGQDLSVLELADGDFATGFAEVTPATSGSGNGTGTLTIPNGKRGIYFQERLWVVTDEGVYISDVRNFTRYSLLNQFRIETGSNDELVAIYPFGYNSIVAFKTRSVHGRYNLVADDAGDLTAAVGDVISSTHGVVAPRAIAQAGRDVFYFGQNGLTSIQLTEENKLKSVDTPISEDLRATWRRINWGAISRSTLAYWDSKLYWAIPVDRANVCNAVAVFDTQTGTWQGTDEGVAFDFGIVSWFIADYGGEPRLFCLDGQGLVRLYEAGPGQDMRQGEYLLSESTGAVLRSELGTPLLSETLGQSWVNFTTSITTRGYDHGTSGHKRFLQAETQLATYASAVAVTAKVEGVEENLSLAPGLSPDRTRYTVFNRPPYDPGNAGDDFAVPHREDYSVVLPEAGMLLHDGIVLDRFQSWELPRRINRRSRYVQLQVNNSEGLVQVRGTMVRATVVRDSQLQRT